MGDFRIDFSKRIPAYMQIAEEILGRLATGALKEGDRLPTIHEMARMAGVNPNTVVRAYRELEGQGLIEGRPGMGTFLKRPEPVVNAGARGERLREICLRSLREAYLIGVGAEELAAFMASRAPGRKEA